jgi:hypothetical protein
MGIPVGGRRKHKIGGTFKSEGEVGDHLGLDTTSKSLEDDPSKEDNEDNEDDDAYDSSSDPSRCGDCYGAGENGECCDTCDDVRRAYRRKGWTIKPGDTSITQCERERNRGMNRMEGEGCSIYGNVLLQAGGGNLHVAPGKSLEDLVGGEGYGGSFQVGNQRAKGRRQQRTTHHYN